MKPDPYLWRRPGTGTYYVIHYDECDKKRMESLRTKDLSTAQDRLYLWKQQRAKELASGVRRVGVPLGKATKEYLEHYEKRNKAVSTKRYKNALDNVLEFVGRELPLGALQVKDLQEYQLHRIAMEIDKRTVDYEIDVVRAFLNWCKRRSWVHENVAGNKHVERLSKKVDSREKRIFTDKELEILLSPQEGQHWQRCFIFNVLYYTGLRIGELSHLTIKDVDLVKREIVIREKTLRVPVWNWGEKKQDIQDIHWAPKSYEKRIVPIEPRLLPLLEEFQRKRRDNIFGLYFMTPRGNRITDHLGRQIKALTGKRDVSVHTFRHTHISHALNRWGRHPSVVQKWVGHKDLKTTMQYIHVSMEDLHREAAKTQ